MVSLKGGWALLVIALPPDSPALGSSCKTPTSYKAATGKFSACAASLIASMNQQLQLDTHKPLPNMSLDA
jgi:hypothetical protein